MVIKKLHVPRCCVPIKCPIVGCKYKTYMQKKLFDVLPKRKGFQNHLDFGQDYMVWYQNEVNSETLLSNETWKVTKFLNEFKKHFRPVHNEFLIANTAPIVIRSSIFIGRPWRRRVSHNTAWWRTRSCSKNRKIRNLLMLQKGEREGLPPKRVSTLGCLYVGWDIWDLYDLIYFKISFIHKLIILSFYIFGCDYFELSLLSTILYIFIFSIQV